MAYLWIAYPSKPGCTGSALRLTADCAQPKRIEPRHHHNALTGAQSDLVYADSMYGAWQLLGEVDGELVCHESGEGFAIRRRDGYVWEDYEIKQAGLYRVVASA